MSTLDTDVVDAAFVDAVTAAADAAVDQLLAGDSPASLGDAPLGPHRESMRRAKLLVVAYLAPNSRRAGDRRLTDAAQEYAAALEAMQSRTGLFLGGDNVESPPDSGFTINDLGDVLELIARSDARSDLSRLDALLRSIADRATPAMLAGGVHTPNHRWELAAALTRLHRVRPDESLRARIEQWLAEGVDIDGDGLYSERSANYAAHVSNPSLLVIADALQRPELLDVVELNLTATLGLMHTDGSVETVHSRRQDQQTTRFPLAPYALHFRRLAIERGRGDFAWAARRALAEGIAEPQTALAELLLHPVLSAPLPAEEPPPVPARSTWGESGLVIDRTPRRTLVVYGGSDYRAFRRVRSGLANNPTFLRMTAGPVVLEGLRLSREFFGLGPFRADAMEHTADGLVLREELTPAYYQPLPAELRRADGRYELVDEGRFAAAMAFDRRPADIVSLRTRIDVRPTDDGAELVIATEGPSSGWALELAFREGGSFEGLEPVGDEAFVLSEGWGRYRVGNAAMEFGPGAGVGGRPRYSPGEDYDYVGGTDALPGPRAYITGRSPGTVHLRLRAVD
ncbi:hypothetical protein K0817_005180 [Microbacterium sp. HD4P20]|uniref:hypothetical protein n=1 Tax=Microbacterium sp. HD4P20 TaxID=2864874 RepID=UPI001C6442A6|nr:hypothetical protein [Microbacterium sp. HD4P20]MCP2635962.1 hypothetical protein [Microbacterium sp. HD4P20]